MLNALYAVVRVLSSQSGQRQMLAAVLDILYQELAMERGTILLLSPDGSELFVEAAQQHSNIDQKSVRYQRGEGIVGRVLQSGVPTIVPRIADEPLFCDRIYRRKAMGGDQFSFICVPVLIGTEVIGTLSVDLRVELPEMLQDAQQLLCIVASMLASDMKARREFQQERAALEAENLRLRSVVEEQFRPHNIIGNSHAIRQVYLRIQQVATSNTTVLIRGESGTGKELVASAIHYNSHLAKGPLVKVNCAALNEQLIESELFGHEKGAFTGALRDRIGRIEEAQEGTLFLDEIGEFSPTIQVKLLRVIQEREFTKVGSNRVQHANIRIITATNRNLETAVADGLFRQDLYYRINVFPIFLPPLRERKDDLLLLADHLAHKYGQKSGKNIRRISTTAINMMLAYHWPGNIRELENCLEYAVLLSTDGVIHGHTLPPTLQTPDASLEPSQGTLKNRTNILEKDAIIDALKRSSGNVNMAAHELGITSRMVRYKLHKFGIDSKSFVDATIDKKP